VEDLAERLSRLSPDQKALFLDRLKSRLQGDRVAGPVPVAHVGPLPLSAAQRRMWFLQQLDPRGTAYAMPFALRLRGDLRVDVLARVLSELVRRHAGLRSTFAAVDGMPVLQIAEPAALDLAVRDVTAVTDAEREAAIQSAVRQEAAAGFDLTTGPLFRPSLLRLAPDDHVLMVTMHHIISDGWSVGLLVRETAVLYQAFATGQPSPLPALAVQYVDFAAWQAQTLQGESLQGLLDYWKERLAGDLAPLNLPTDRPRPALATHGGAIRYRRLEPDLVGGLSALAQQHQASLYMLFLAAFQTLMARLSGQADIIVGSPVAGRSVAAIEPIVGMFVNTVALRSDVAAGKPFSQLLQEVRETCLGALAHEALPFEMLVQELALERDQSRPPLVQVLLVMQNQPAGRLEIPGVTLDLVPIDERQAKFDLSVSLQEGPAGLAMGWEYNTDLFDAATIERWMGHFQTLLGAIVAMPQQTVDRLPLLTASEVDQLLTDWNQTAVAYPTDVCLHSLIERQVDRTPAAPAVTFEGGTLIYRDLEARANRLAHYLIACGVGPDVLVGVCMERSLDLVVSLLAVLKAGGAYVPMDPGYPADRLAYMVSDADCPVVLSQSGLADILPDHAGRTVFVDGDWPTIGAQPDSRPQPAVRADHLAYVIYTSGSTGRPKGAMNEHRGIVNRLLWMQDAYGLDASDVVLQKTPFSFDVSVWEFFWPLLTGSRLVVAQPGGHQDPAYLADLIRAEGVTTLHFVPPMLQIFLEEPSVPGCTSLKRVICSGEALPTELAGRFFQRLPAELHNLYGPTEAAVDVTYWPCHADEAVMIGWPIANIQMHILDPHLQPVPLGVAGELHIGGIGVGRGYWRRPELTAEKFLPNPFGTATLYKTGDLARYRSDGAIDYLGRIDHQVKLRGFRIELGEIETAVRAQAGVREAIILVREDRPGDKRLVAYLTALADGVDVAALADGLKQQLPVYMVPSAFVVLEAMPLSPNGKIDRKALPAPDWAETETAYATPATAMETLVAGIWANVLGLERVGRQDDFFALGGHSLLGVQVVSRLRQATGRDLPLRWLFEAPVLASLAERLDAQPQAVADEHPLVAVPRDRALTASDSQQRMWLLQMLAPDSIAFNARQHTRVRGALDLVALEQAFRAVIARHEALRTVFRRGEDGLEQVILPITPWSLPTTDVGDLPPAEREAEAQRRIDAMDGQVFDLATGPMLRVLAVRLGPDDHVIAICTHHIVADGWTLRLLGQQLLQDYEAFRAGRASPTPPPPIQYADYAVWQQRRLESPEMARQQDFWVRQLALPWPVLDLPAGNAQPSGPSVRGAEVTTLVAGTDLTAWRKFGQGQGTTFFMVLLAAFSALMHRYTGADDLIVGTPVANRTRPELESVVGYFGNNLALRVPVTGGLTFRQLLGVVRTTVLDAFANGGVPLEQVLRSLAGAAGPAAVPFQSMVVLQNLPEAGDDPSGLTMANFGMPSTREAKLDLTLYARELADGLTLALEYRADLFTDEAAGRMLTHLQQLANAAIAAPDRPLSALPMLAADEQRRLSDTWNHTSAPYPSTATIHDLITAMAEGQPDTEAARFAGAGLTYAELDRRANQLAHHLRRLGLQPEQLVTVFMERASDLPVALLAVLKAGGAFVPVDPTYPADRIALMVADTQGPVVLTQSHLLGKLPAVEATVCCVDRDWPEIAASPDTPPAAGGSADSLAAVLYTSGSTGRPKGVMLTHRGIVNHAYWLADLFGIRPGDRILHQTTLSFDNALWETLGALISGATVVLAKPWGQMDPDYLAGLIGDERIQYMACVPTLLLGLLETGRMADAADLSHISVGGEALPIDLMRRCHEALPTVRLVNTYGPSEATIDASAWVSERGATQIRIGRPVANTRCYVVDGSLNLVPEGCAGELVVAGDGLARGYWRQEALTAERFVANPFGPGRLYRTGDRARWCPDGTLEHLGRLDDQVKVRGLRIEPGEIEAVLLTRAGVREAAIVLREVAPGDKRLIGYVTPLPGAELDGPALREALAAHLPAAMVPAAVLVLANLPLTPSGKLDRRALPAPDPLAEIARRERVAPRNDVEARIAAIWQAVLRVAEVGVTDSFFALGGHSLLATQVLARIQQRLCVEVGLPAFFAGPTVAELALAVGHSQAVAGTERIEGQERPAVIPLSYSQQRLWFLDQLDPGNPNYNIATAWRLQGPLDRAALAAAFSDAVARHEGLRTSFDDRDGVPQQRVAAPFPVAFTEHDLRGLAPAEGQARREALLASLSRHRFDLSQLPLFRASLVVEGDADAVLHLVIHHVVADGWSIAVLMADVAAAYQARLQGRAPDWQPLALQYPDFALWQRQWLDSGRRTQELTYWAGQLDGVPTLLDLPVDKPRPAAPTNAGGRQRLVIAGDLVDRVRRFAAAQGATPYMVLMAAFQSLLHRYTRQERFLVGTPIANRARPELEPLVGFFVNTLVIPADLREVDDFAALVQRVKAATIGAFAHQDLPFDLLVNELQPDRSLSRSPLIQALFVLQNVPPAAESLAGDLTMAPVPVHAGAAKFDLVMELFDAPEAFAGYLEYSLDAFDAATIERMATHFTTLLAGLLADGARRLEAVPMISPAERRALLSGPQAAPDWVIDQPVQDLLQAHVLARPGATALVGLDGAVSYGELDRLTNQMAHVLQAAGVVPGDPVGVCLTRSPGVVLALIGILKAGGTYVPLDPGYPTDRLAFMIGDASVSLVVTDAASRTALPRSVEVLLLPDAASLAKQPATAPAADVSAEAVAYIIYTSGSTGHPKGVPLRHRGLCNLVQAQIAGFGLTADARTLQFASTSFDASISEIFTALASGGELHLLPSDQLMPGEGLVAALQTRRITHITLPPSVLALLSPADVPDLQTVISAGEACPAAVMRRWAASRTFINAYGPTEVTVCATQGPCLADDPFVTIGRALPGVQVLILDHEGDLVPLGVPGELCVGGVGLSPGYLNRPDLTAERFIANAYGQGRLYRTGDLARSLPDGRIQYLGRIDQQVKIRGFRIEPGEIETLLLQHPAVRQAVVAPRTLAGDAQLVAYLVLTTRLRMDRVPIAVACIAEYGGNRYEVRTQDLSYGGLCLTGAPAAWQVDRTLRIGLQLPGSDAQRWFEGEIAWLQAGRAGIKLTTEPAERQVLHQAMEYVAHTEGISLLEANRAGSRLPMVISCLVERADGRRQAVGTVDLSYGGTCLTGVSLDARRGELLRLRLQLPGTGVAMWFDADVAWQNETLTGVRFELAALQKSVVRTAMEHIAETEGLSLLHLRRFLQERLPEYMVPSLVVLLDDLPLTPNGKVDRSALPRPTAADAGGRHHVAPRNHVEIKLVQIWEALLGISPIGITDNFFEIGGHSLMAVQMMARLQADFGQRPSLATLFEGPTIERLAVALMHMTGTRGDSPLVAIQPSGDLMPFFCIHPVGGSVLAYAELARLLGLEQPFFGLQARGLEGEAPPRESIQEMATAYIDAIKLVRPEGPYLLGGWSLGGVIAFEMARQLEAAGENVPLVVLFDSRLPVKAQSPGEDLMLRLFARDLAGYVGDAWPVPTGSVPLGQKLERLLAHAHAEGLVDSGLEPAQLQQIYAVFAAHAGALQGYQPGLVQARLMLFRAKFRPEAEPSDITLGWGDHAQGAVEIDSLPSDHYTMLRSPFVEVLAERLRATLREIAHMEAPPG
jgi:amino acid adenylation domain-containing protein